MPSESLKRHLPSSAVGLDLALTSRCPLRCRFCTVAKTVGHELTAAGWCEVISGVARLRPIELISLEGGEPLTRPDLPEILAASLAHAAQVKLVTSGALTLSAPAAELARHPRFMLEVSVDGPPDVHDFLRDGSSRAAWEFIHRASDLGIRLRLRTVVSAFNLGTLDEWLGAVDRHLEEHRSSAGFRFDTLIAPEVLESMGGPEMRQPVRRSGGLAWLPSPGEVMALYERLRVRRFRRLRFEQTEAFRGCGAGRLPLVSFDPAGRFSFCCEAPRSFGSIRDVSAETLLALLDAQMSALPCRGCAHLTAGNCDGCWTGQKCGMVGAWNLPGCRELLDSTCGRPGAGSSPCQPRCPAVPSSSVFQTESCPGI